MWGIMSNINKSVEALSKPLCASDVEVRVGVVTAKGVSLLLYKTARTDIARLNEAVGLNWKREHYYDAKGLLLCKISIFNGSEWVGREDVGVESNTQKQKGLYSDAMKRSGFSWGIGIELYKAPFIFITCETVKDGNSYKLKNRYAFNNAYVSDYLVCDNGLHIIIKDSRKANTIFDNLTAANNVAQKVFNADDAKKHFNTLTAAEDINKAKESACARYPQSAEVIELIAIKRLNTLDEENK